MRFFVVNAGPSLRSDFHIVGAVFDRVYPDGNPKNVLNSLQTWSIPAGGGAVFETEFKQGESGEECIRPLQLPTCSTRDFQPAAPLDIASIVLPLRI